VTVITGLYLVIFRLGDKDALIEEMAKIKLSLDFCFSKDDKGKVKLASFCCQVN
jgi:hypothetical protein